MLYLTKIFYYEFLRKNKMGTLQIPVSLPMTFEQAIALLDKQKAETLAKIEADRLETFAKIEADKKLHYEDMMKRDEELKLQMMKRDEEFKELSRRFGDLGNRLGDIIECIIAPNLQEKFRKYGFDFHNSSTHLIVKEGKKTITDIDVVLEDGGDCMMLVEVKTKPTIDDVYKHIERMEKIQLHPTRGMRGAKIYGAIACAILDDDVKKLIFASGFYLICQMGDNVDIMEPPSDFSAKYWEAK